MSIEADLNRMATALEEILKALRGSATLAIAPGVKSPAAEPVKKTKVTPPAPVVEMDPITGQPVPVNQEAQLGAAQPTLDEVHVQLRLLKDNPKFGVETCKTLMVKHGADAAKPIISSIPPKNYAAIIAEIGQMLK